MTNPSDDEGPVGDPDSAGGDDLAEALRLYFEHRARGSTESDSQFLTRHEPLRALLEPLLTQDAARSGGLAAGSVLGDYRLIGLLGRGGMGEVWEAEQISLKRRVALKLLRHPLLFSDKVVGRFQREALAGARIRHPSIVAVHAVGEACGVHYISQELIESGRSLAQALRELRELPAIPADYWRETAERFARIADALQLAHECGVIHRDLKPSNILLAADGVPKVADFGLATVAGEQELSRSGDMSGSPFYMSPEQAAARRAEIDARSDVFSLGATLFEALTLQRPFDGDTVAQVLTKIMFLDPRDPRDIRSLCPRDLAVICMRMLEKAPGARYQSMGEVRDELQRFLRSEPIRAKPPGVLGRLARWSRRRPVLAASGAIVCVSLAVVSILLLETMRARNQAELSAVAARDSALAEAAAARAAQVSAEEARTEAHTSARVVDFLVEAFSAANPDRALGREISVREVLDRGVANIRNGLNQPAERGLRARLLDSLGSVYSRLGLRKEAEELLLEARSLSEAVFGADDARTLGVLESLATHFSDCGRFEDACVLLERVYRTRVTAEGDTSIQALLAETTWGSSLVLVGEFELALLHLRHSSGELRRLGQPSGDALSMLAELLLADGRREEALTLFDEALSEFEAFEGPDHPKTLAALEGKARERMRASAYGESLDLYRRIAISRTCVLGDSHPTALLAWARVARLNALSDPAGAILELSSLLATCRRELRPRDPTTIKITEYLAEVYLGLGRFAEAEVTCAEILGMLAAELECTPRDRAQHLLPLALSEWHLARSELALGLMQEVLDLGEHEPSAADPTFIDRALDVAIQAGEASGEYTLALGYAHRRWDLLPPQHPGRAVLEDTIVRLEEALNR